jgi:hypothetical protein
VRLAGARLSNANIPPPLLLVLLRSSVSISLRYSWTLRLRLQ